MAAIKPAKKTNKIIRIKSKLKINEALVVCNVKILWVKILNSKKPIKIPKNYFKNSLFGETHCSQNS